MSQVNHYKNIAMTGPVLRNAVQSTLEKRKMTFERRIGSFVVRVDSGFELVANRTKSDSKVIIIPSDELGPNIIHRAKLANNTPTVNSNSMLLDDNALLPSEVKAFDDNLEKGKNLSLDDIKLKKKDARKEENDVKKALMISMQVEKEEMKERRALEEIMIASEREYKEKERKEWEDIEAAIQDSIEMKEKLCEEKCDLEKAMADSMLSYKETNEELNHVLKISADYGKGNLATHTKQYDKNDSLRQDGALKYAQCAARSNEDISSLPVENVFSSLEMSPKSELPQPQNIRVLLNFHANEANHRKASGKQYSTCNFLRSIETPNGEHPFER